MKMFEWFVHLRVNGSSSIYVVVFETSNSHFSISNEYFQCISPCEETKLHVFALFGLPEFSTGKFCRHVPIRVLRLRVCFNDRHSAR